MASYKSGFDPPTRPQETSRARRLGTYMQQNAGKQEKLEQREPDLAQQSGQAETRRPAAAVGRPQQTTLPRPRMREPSPSMRPRLEGARTGSSSSSFGYGRNAPKMNAPAAKPTPELRGKSSRNVLRRKASSVAQEGEASRPKAERQDSSSSTKDSSASSERKPSLDATHRSAEAYNEIFTRAPRTRTPARESPQIYPELDRYRARPEHGMGSRHVTDFPPKLSTQDLPPPTPLLSGTPGYSAGSSHHRYSGYSGSGYSASPSTRFSESPGPGAYSRDTTPTSISSQSPSIMAPMKSTTTPRLRQGSPALNRPPVVTRRRANSIPTEPDASQGLPSLRESVTSSSSSSTVKGDGKGKEKEKEKKKKKRLSPMPPSPPPRKSSQKFKKAKSDEIEESPSKSSSAPAKPVMMSPSESSPAKPVRSVTSPAPKVGPPRRPSRDGAPDLHAQLGHIMPVVQSNLTGLPQNRRQSSLPMPRSVGTSPQLSSQPTMRPQLGSRLPSRNNPSPSPVLYSPREATPAPSGLGIIPDLRPQPTSRGISRTPSPSISNTKSRFGLFGRRTKTTPEIPNVENKGSRKGPTAGTGHEGYGKYATRGRSSSAGGFSSRQGSVSLSIAASTSQESVSSTRTHDPFLLHRMSPVIIAGGGEIVENQNEGSELLRTESGASLLLDRGLQSLEPKVPSLSHEASRTTLWPSALPREAPNRASAVMTKGRRPSDSSDDGVGKSSLAFRRSQRFYATGPLNLPRPLKFGERTTSTTSLDASVLSDESQPETKTEIGTAKKGILTKPKKLEKKPKESRKWNFFHRAQPKDPQPEVVQALPVVVGRAPAKAVPHYALLDSSDEQLDPDSINLEDLIRDAEVVAMSNEELDALQFGSYKENIRRNEKIDTKTAVPEPTPAPEPKIEAPPAPILFSSPEPMQQPRIPQTDLHLTQEPARVRPSRLPQVGRIPKVISARPETTSPKSFSRPFARLSTHQPLTQPLVIDQQSLAVGPSPPKPSTPELQPEPTISPLRESTSSKSESTSVNHRDFLAFSPRKNSEATTSSSGGGLSFADTTAVIPLPDDPLEEDEMWDEYDDLLSNTNNENETIKVPLSATSSQGLPFQYEKYESRRMRKSNVQAKESPTLTSGPIVKEPEKEMMERRSVLTSSSVYSVDMSARLKDALTNIPSPTTPLSFSEFFSGYGDRNLSTQRRSDSSSRSRKSNASALSGLGLGVVREGISSLESVNLRVGSMTVSKWLTFGHVLFSPAREEVVSAGGDVGERHEILVVDGLGNDDWSFYAAETYPNSTFYNLSPTHPSPQPTTSLSPTSPPSKFLNSPPNHHQIHHPTQTAQVKFPFPSNNFNKVVYRFPRISSPSVYKHIISESKRVLKPGGYLEFTVLDLDMGTMGPLTRRSIRNLKVRLSRNEGANGQGLNLSSAGDLVGKELAKRGWGEVRSCVLGVPVACEISNSTSSGEGEGEGGERVLKEEKSLSDLLRGSESSETDKDITKMVARVGRWWFGRCYEFPILDNDARGSGSGVGGSGSGGGRGGEGSVFDNKEVLNECETWRSSFKLFVGVARKCSLSEGYRRGVGRRRGASV